MLSRIKTRLLAAIAASTIMIVSPLSLQAWAADVSYRIVDDAEIPEEALNLSIF